VVDGGQFVARSSGCSTALKALRQCWQCTCTEARCRSDFVMHILGLSGLPHGSRPRASQPENRDVCRAGGCTFGSHHVCEGARASSRHGSQPLAPFSPRGGWCAALRTIRNCWAFGAERRMLRKQFPNLRRNRRNASCRLCHQPTSAIADTAGLHALHGAPAPRRPPRRSRTASEIEAKTTELMREFSIMLGDYREQYPGAHDPRTI